MIRVRGIPIYWGVETEAVDKRFLVYSVLHEASPPFRHSTYGIRIRISPWHYLHVGKYLYDKNLRLYGMHIQAFEISTWGFHDEEKEGAKPIPVESVQPVERERPDQLHRSVDAEDGGTLPWTITTATGQCVGPRGNGDER